MFEYFDGIRDILKKVEKKESENITKAIDMFYSAIKNKNSIFVFGASHAGIITQELFYRAGGLMSINPIFDESLQVSVDPVTKTSAVEKLEGYGELIANKTPFSSDDILLVHSVSGRNPVIIDLVIKAREAGVKIIGLTNLKYSQSVSSRHSLNKNLYEYCDLVIDNHGDIGDGMISIPGVEQKVAPSSTVVGATIVNTIVTETVKKLVESGVETPPIFYSANLDGGAGKNKKNIKEYLDTIHYNF